ATARDYRARSLYVEDLDKPARGRQAADLRLIDSSVFSGEPPRIVDHELDAARAGGPAPEPEATPSDIPDFLRPYRRSEAPAHEERYEQIKILPDTEPEKRPRTATQGKVEPVDISVAAPPPREYVFPPIELLHTATPGARGSRDDYLENARKLEDTLLSFGITAKVIQISRGPAITRYELQPAPGVKISRIVNLSNDIALNMAARGVRIEAPIPGKAAIGIEIANSDISTVFLRDVIESSAFTQSGSKITVCLGKDIAGKNIVTDLAKMPHLMIAGATGSGKSVCINCLIVSLLYKARPDEVRLIMVDPKVVELSVYNGIPHLLIPVVTDPKKAAGALNWAVQEMTRRYQLFAEKKARDLTRYNQLAEEAGEEPLPQIVIIIDELADLMVVAPAEVEDAICRLAQMARAAGMHLVIATQRPSVDVITGVIKANIPSRIAFAVYSQTDSRTILDMGGAEKLLGRGDMLFHPSSSPKPVRVQGAFVDEPEVESIVSFIRGAQEESEYDEEIIKNLESFSSEVSGEGEDMGPQGLDELITDAIEVVHEQGQASISMMQRRLRVGYARAARLVDEMEQLGIVGPADGSKPRPILRSKMESLAIVNGTDHADEL
ncbi:MAG: DNA translocase FtsK, partial [Clostridiales bacterium]|nr:DNA translocase FtsK [Clostridiales bacterium]